VRIRSAAAGERVTVNALMGVTSAVTIYEDAAIQEKTCATAPGENPS
jgi:hypothetical protein